MGAGEEEKEAENEGERKTKGTKCKATAKGKKCETQTKRTKCKTKTKGTKCKTKVVSTKTEGNEIIDHCRKVKELVAWQATAHQLRCGGLCQRWSTDPKSEGRESCEGAGHEVRMGRKKKRGAKRRARSANEKEKKGAPSAGHEVQMRRQVRGIGL